MFRYCSSSCISIDARGSRSRTSSARRRISATCSAIFAASWSRTMNSTSASSAPPEILVGWTKPSRSSVVSGESASRGRPATRSAASLIALTSCPLAVPGMRRAAADRHGHPRRVERLRLDLAQLRAVERVGVAGAEALDVEMVGAARDLLVDGEADADRRVLELGMALQICDRGHDLRHAGLVVGAEQRRPVGGDDVVADLLLQQRQLLGVEDDARVARELDRAAVVALVHLRVDVRPGDVGRGVDVRDQPDRGRRLDARAASRRRSRTRRA